VAPLNGASGTRRGRRTIWGGRAPVRTVFYRGTLVATRDTPQSNAFYERLLAAGTVKKVALTGISSIISGDELTCLAGLPGTAKAGIMALDPCNFPVLEPRATCLKTLT
jgi:Transposase IS116/IS110/IS902 family